MSARMDLYKKQNSNNVDTDWLKKKELETQKFVYNMHRKINKILDGQCRKTKCTKCKCQN